MDARKGAAVLRQCVAVLGSRPPTLLHGDLHPGNFWFSKRERDQPPAGAPLQVLVCDWQFVLAGPPGVDIATYSAFVPREDHPKILSELLPRYYERFLESAPAGTEGRYSFEELVEDWKCQLLIWWFFFVHGFGDGLRAGNSVTQRVFASWIGRLWNLYIVPGVELPAFAERMYADSLRQKQR